MIKTSLLSRPSSRIKSALDKNLNANANSINPKITLTLLNHIPDLGKWVLSLLMLMGRLELFTVLILFTPFFWKKN